jgi:hypothetical protein
MFLGSPVPMKKWHLSAQAPQRTQMSMKTLMERNRSRRSLKPSWMICCQFSGSFQSSSSGFQGRALGSPSVFDAFGVGGIAVHPLADVDRHIHPVGGGRLVIYAVQKFFGLGGFICHGFTPFPLPRSLTRVRVPAFCPPAVRLRPSFTELVFVGLVGVHLDRIVPGVDVAQARGCCPAGCGWGSGRRRPGASACCGGSRPAAR